MLIRKVQSEKSNSYGCDVKTAYTLVQTTSAFQKPTHVTRYSFKKENPRHKHHVHGSILAPDLAEPNISVNKF